MTLTVGTGPFGHIPAGSFSIEIPSRDRLLYVEPSQRWIRGVLGEETAYDSRDGARRLRAGKAADLLLPARRRPHRLPRPVRAQHKFADPRRGALVQPAGERARRPRTPLGALRSAPRRGGGGGVARLRRDALDRWYEEDEELIVHLRDPYHRIDVIPTSRHVRMSLDGDVLAETRRGGSFSRPACRPLVHPPRGRQGGAAGAKRSSHRLRLQGIRLLPERSARRPRGGEPGLDLSRTAPRGRPDRRLPLLLQRARRHRDRRRAPGAAPDPVVAAVARPEPRAAERR